MVNKEDHKAKNKKEEKPREDLDDQEELEDEEDFGGLPDRDLKKNLGCG